jgi:hypothetical protein
MRVGGRHVFTLTEEECSQETTVMYISRPSIAAQGISKLAVQHRAYPSFNCSGWHMGHLYIKKLRKHNSSITEMVTHSLP